MAPIAESVAATITTTSHQQAVPSAAAAAAAVVAAAPSRIPKKSYPPLPSKQQHDRHDPKQQQQQQQQQQQPARSAALSELNAATGVTFFPVSIDVSCDLHRRSCRCYSHSSGPRRPSFHDRAFEGYSRVYRWLAAQVCERVRNSGSVTFTFVFDAHGFCGHFALLFLRLVVCLN